MQTSALRTAATAAVAIPSSRVHFADGSLEALKWIALVLMTADHINAYLMGWAHPWVFNAARVVMPVFGFILAYNLTRASTDEETYRRILKRLGIAALCATPAFFHFHHFWPLSVLATLWLFVAIVYCLEFRPRAGIAVAVLAFVIGGTWVEFWWFGLAVCLSAWSFLKAPSSLRVMTFVTCVCALAVVNRNLYAIAALPLIGAAYLVPLKLPRFRNIFYAYYPAHLTLIWILAVALGVPAK